MTTQIEMQYMEAIKRIARVMSEPKQIDWERRRYEIAKDILASALNSPFVFAAEESDDDREYCAIKAVRYADALIAELQKSKCQ